MEISLVMFKTDGTRREFPLKRESLIVGRTNDADLRVPLPSVSRKHCEFSFDGSVVTMRDLGSSNGTLHNSTRVDEAVLTAGDRIDVGPVSFYLMVDGEPAELLTAEFDVDPQASDADVALAISDDEDDIVPPTAQTVVEEPPAPVGYVEFDMEIEPEPEPEVFIVESDEPEPIAAEMATPEPEEAEPFIAASVVPEPAPTPPPAPARPKVSVSPSPAKPVSKPAISPAAKATPAPPAPSRKAVKPEPEEELDLEDALAKAATKDAASVKPPKQAESVEFEDPIDALQALADAENASNNEFAGFFDDEDSASKDGS